MSHQVTPERGRTFAEMFEKYHEDHPEVYDFFVESLRRWKKHSLVGDKCSMAMLIGHFRFTRPDKISDELGFKFNDHVGPFYARLIMREEPDLHGVFTVRQSHADRWIDTYPSNNFVIEQQRQERLVKKAEAPATDNKE